MLYIVATPIGNLEDITLRSLEILKKVDLIAAEDTRHTRKLLTHYNISTPITSYYEHNEFTKGPFLLKQLQSGKEIALVTDAGTPGISDPGSHLVKLAIESGIQVIPIPGPSALIAGLSASGLSTESFIFEGFVPSQSGRMLKFFQSLRNEKRTLIFYEAPHRFLKTLEAIKAVFGDRMIVICRELTKVYEEILRGSADELLIKFQGKPIKGEITLIIAGAGEKQGIKEFDVLEEIKQYKRESNLSLKEIVQLISTERKIPKRVVYKEALKVKNS